MGRLELGLQENIYGDLAPYSRLSLLSSWGRPPVQTALFVLIFLMMTVLIGGQLKRLNEEGTAHFVHFWSWVDLAHHLAFVLLVLSIVLEDFFLHVPADQYRLSAHTDTEASAYTHRMVLSFGAFFVLLSWVRVTKFLRVVKEVHRPRPPLPHLASTPSLRASTHGSALLTQVGVLVEVIVLMLFSLKALMIVWVLFILGYTFAYQVMVGETEFAFSSFSRSMTYSFQASIGMTNPDLFVYK